MRAFTSLLIVLAVGASIVPTAHGAWAPPAEVPGSTGSAPIALALVHGRDPVVTLSGPDLLGPAFSAALPDGTFPPPTRALAGLAPAGQATTGGQIATSPGGRTIVAVRTSTGHGAAPYTGTTRGPSYVLAGDGAAGRAVRVAFRDRFGSSGSNVISVAINDRGDAAVLFSHCGSLCEVAVAFKRPRSGFSRPIVLERHAWRAAGAVTFNERGDALIAWERPRAQPRLRDVAVRVRTAAGRLTRVAIVGPTASIPQFAVTLTDGGAGLVAWHSQGQSEGSVGGPVGVFARTVDRAGHLGALRTLETSQPFGEDGYAVSGPRIAGHLDAQGRTTLAWTGIADGHFVVRAIRLPGDLAPSVISTPGIDAVLADLAGDDRGDALAVWGEGFHGTYPASFDAPHGALVVARRAGAAGGFLPPETIASGPALLWSAFVALAADGSRAALTWTSGGPLMRSASNSVVAVDPAPFP